MFMMEYYNSLGDGSGIVVWLDKNPWLGWVVALIIIIIVAFDVFRKK